MIHYESYQIVKSSSFFVFQHEDCYLTWLFLPPYNIPVTEMVGFAKDSLCKIIHKR